MQVNIRLAKELENLKLDKGVMHSQLEATIQQRDDNKRMYETLLGVINSQNPGSAESLIGAKRIV